MKEVQLKFYVAAGMQCFILIFIFSSNFAFADILDLSPFHQISHAAQGLKRLASSIPILSNIERYRRIHELQKEMAENRAHVSKDQKDPGSELLAILNDDVPENAKENYKPDDKQHRSE